MNDVEHQGEEWQTFANDWREQPGGKPDADALLRGVRRRGWRLRWNLASDLATAAFVVALCLWAMRMNTGLPDWVFAALMTVVLVFQGWALWIRRRQARDSGLDANALVALDIRRTRTTLLYWRISIWLGLALWLALYAVTWSAHVSPWPGDNVTLRELVYSVLASALVGPGFAMWAWWWSRRNRRRLTRMLELRDELERD